MSKKSFLRILSMFMIIMLVMGTALVSAFAITIGGKKIDLTEETSGSDENRTKNYKDETVYVIAKANGDVDKIIVSDWIQNVEKKDKIEDVSTLKDIKNVRGDETYTINKDNMQVWDANGNDLYIQGEGTKELPVEVRLSYKLDGKMIAPEDLAGKSGKVDITFDYENNQYENVKIDGKTVKMAVPYVMLSGVIFDNDKFKDVTVTDGKIINLGEKTVVAGLALPGLQEDLELDEKDFDLPSSVTVSAQAEDFELDTTMTVATNDIFSNLKTDSLDDLDDLKSQLSDLQEGMDKLVDGSSQLYTGIATLLDKSGELAEGVNALDDGAKAVSDGAKTLSDGTVRIDAGMLDLSGGINQLTAYNSDLTGGSEKVFESLLSEATQKLNEAGIACPKLTQENYNDVLDKIISSLDEEKVEAQAQQAAREKVTAGVEESREAVVQGVTAAVQENVRAAVEEQVRQNVRAQVLASQGFTEETYAQAVSEGIIDSETAQAMESAIESTFASDEVQSQIDDLTQANMSSEETQTIISEQTESKIASLIEENMNSEEVASQIEAAKAKAAEGKKQVEALKATLNEYSQFDAGINNYTNGVSSAGNGAYTLKQYTSQLSDGASTLAEGSKELSSGTSELRSVIPSLTSGISKLAEGSMTLSEGLKEFNKKGISKITELGGDDLSNFTSRFKAMVDVSKKYNTYSGISEDMDGEVKFIYKTEAIKQ